MASGFSKYDRPETTQSRYCYQGTDVLINKENITDAKALAKYEADMTILRQYELEIGQAVKGSFGIAHLKRIHKYIFNCQAANLISAWQLIIFQQQNGLLIVPAPCSNSSSVNGKAFVLDLDICDLSGIAFPTNNRLQHSQPKEA